MEDNIYRDERIQAYLDGLCTEKEAREIEQKIATDTAWSKSFEDFSEIHRLLQSGQGLMEPSMRFTKNVMESIEGLHVAKPVRKYLNPWINRIFAGILVLFLGACLFYALVQTDWSSGNVTIPVKVPDVGNPLASISTFFDSQATLLFFAANMVLGMVLIDYRLKQKKRSKGAKAGITR